MNEAEVVELMRSSTSEEEWDDNCDRVKEACNGYPDFWYRAILSSGVMTETVEKFGGSAEMQVGSLVPEATGERPATNIYGRPTAMPHLGEGERVVGVWDQGLGEKRTICSSLEEMQNLHNSYASGMALRLRWVIESTV